MPKKKESKSLANIGRTKLFRLLKNKCYREAIAYLNIKLAASPNSKMLWLQKAFVCRLQGLTAAAAKCYDKVIQLAPRSKYVWLWKGNKNRCIGEYAEALKCYNQGLEQDPDNITLLNNKAALLAFMGKFDEAMECYTKILEKNSKNAMVWLNKAKIETQYFFLGSAIDSLENYLTFTRSKSTLSHAKVAEWKRALKAAKG